MALTEFQKQEALKLFSEGRTTSDVFKHLGAKSAGFKSPIEYTAPTSTVEKKPNALISTVADIPQDVLTGVKQLGEGYLGRYERLKGSFQAGLAGEQTPIETGIQMGANIAGGVFADPAYQLLRTGASFATSQAGENKIAQGIGETVQKVGESTGLTDWYQNLDERTKKNVNAALDVADVLPLGLTGKVKSLFTKPTQVDVTPKLEQVITRAEQGDVTDAARVVNAAVDEPTRQKLVDDYAKSLEESLRENRRAVTNSLKTIADDMSRGDNVVTYDQLIKNLAAEGIVPDIDGKLADFTTEIRKLEQRQNELFKQYEPVLANSRATASIDDFAEYTKRSMAQSRNLRFELDKAEAELTRAIENLRRSFGADGQQLTAKQIDDISREANARSSAYRKGNNTFEADVYSELGRAARSWLNENIPDQSFGQVNDEWLRLETIKKTADVLDGQIIDVGVFDRALGSYITTLSGVTLAAATTNPAVAVAVGILTKLGGDKVGDILRNRQFSPEIRTKLQEVMTKDRALIEKLKQTATTQENKNLYDDLSRMLPPARSDVRSVVGSGAPIIVTPSGASAPKGQIVEDAATGAIKTPETGELRPLSRSLYPQITEAELQKLNTDSFRKMLENVGVDVADVKKAIAGGTVGLLLALYLNEDGSTLPAFGAIMGVMASRGGKLQMLDEAIRANNMRREAYLRAGKTEKSPEIKTLDKQMSGLAKEKARIEDSLSVGLGIKDVSGKARGATPQTTALLEEAKGKTLEEFVKAQGTPVYHGGNKVTDIKVGKDSFTGKPVGFSTTPDKAFAERYSQQISRDGEVTELYLKPNAKILDKTEAGIDPHIDPTYSADANLIKDAIAQGYDAVRMRVTAPGGLNEGTSIELQILNPDAVKTKAQLEELWKQANKR